MNILVEIEGSVTLKRDVSFTSVVTIDVTGVVACVSCTEKFRCMSCSVPQCCHVNSLILCRRSTSFEREFARNFVPS